MQDRIGRSRPYKLFIAEWIEHKHLTQDQVAERIGCSPGTVSKLISGHMKQTPQWLAAIAYALGDEVEVTDLFHHPDQPTQADLLRNVPDEQRATIISVIKTLTGKTGTDG